MMIFFQNIKFLGLFFFIAIFFCCKNKPVLSVDKPIASNRNYTKVEIYCWCFFSNNFETISPCTTPKAIETAELIMSKNLFAIVNNSDTIRKLRSLIFDRKRSVEEKTDYPDSRFLMLFRISNSQTDTINVFSGSELHYNNRYYFNYAFNVVDSIKVILNWNEINCKTKPEAMPSVL